MPGALTLGADGRYCAWGTPPVGDVSVTAVDDDSPVPVVLVTGMSGAGKSTALKVLEDLGYEAIDNLPLHLLSRVLAPEDDRAISKRIRSSRK